VRGGQFGARVEFHPASSLDLGNIWQQGGTFDAIEQLRRRSGKCTIRARRSDQLRVR
jgi:hypothetical protein